MNQPELSIVILCYKSGQYAGEFVAEAEQSLAVDNITDYELVLVGNYNKGDNNDQTPAIIAALAKHNPRIKYVARPKEGMMGWDMRSGLELATGKYIAIIDGDGQMPLEDLKKVYQKIKAEKLDLVKTYRITRGDGYKRIAMSFVYNIFFHLFFPGVRSRDINSKPKIFTRAAYERLDLHADDWFIDAEIMIQSKRHNFHIGEIPTYFLGLKGSRRSFVNAAAILEFIKNLIIYRLNEYKRK